MVPNWSKIQLTEAEPLFRAVFSSLLTGLPGHGDCGVSLDGERPQESHGHGGRVDDADIALGKEWETVLEIWNADHIYMIAQLPQRDFL